MNSEHLETTNAPSFSIPSLVTTFRKTAAQHETTDQNASVTQAELSTPFISSEQEESRLVDLLRQTASESGNHAVADAHQFYLLACIRARKGNVSRAFALASNYVMWRSSFGQDQLDLANSPKMQQQLASRLMFVSGIVDKNGRPILNIRSRNHNPTKFSASDTLRTLTFVLEWTLRTYPAAQTHGIAIINDMTGASFKNLDVRIPGVMHTAFANTLPVRLAAINLINPPFVLKAVIGIVTTLLSKKLKARIRIFGKNDQAALSQVIDEGQIPEDIGMDGSAPWTEEQHMEWVQRMMNDCKAWRDVAGQDQN